MQQPNQTLRVINVSSLSHRLLSDTPDFRQAETEAPQFHDLDILICNRKNPRSTSLVQSDHQPSISFPTYNVTFYVASKNVNFASPFQETCLQRQESLK